MTKYDALAITTSYWKPGSNYIDKITNAVEGKVKSNDFVVVSEKAISTALGNVIDENKVKASLNAKTISKFWMRIVWGYSLGLLCHFGQRLLQRLRNYPVESGGRHKQVALERAGVLQALMFGSEGGIDGSNLPYAFVSLPLKNAYEIAGKICDEIRLRLNESVCVIVADSDKTYMIANFFFTPRPDPMKGIHSFGGFTTYIVGRALKLRKSSTPLAVAGCAIGASHALAVTNIADKARGSGSGATVWDMATRFKVDVNDVSLEMLSEIRHKPIVIVRRRND